MKPRILLFAGALIASTNWAAAQAPTSIGTFSVWNAYVSNDPGGKVCFAASQPQSSKYSRTVSSRGDAYFMVTTIPSKSIKNEASTIVGYPFKASSDVTVDVDGTKFKMFFNDATGETSWAVPDQEASLIEAMKKGSQDDHPEHLQPRHRRRRHLLAVRHHRRARRRRQGMPVARRAAAHTFSV